jgi:hypothetical protein
LIPYEVKAKAFNLKQTLSVIEENLPDSASPNSGGMRFLRGLFWAALSSAPDHDRHAGRPEKHPLRFFQRLGDLGTLRSMSQGLQALEHSSERTAFADAIAGVGLITQVPAFDQIVMKVLAQPESISQWIDSSVADPQFEWGTLVTSALSGAARERTLRVAPSMMKWMDRLLGAGPFPRNLIADLLRYSGRKSEDRLSTLRANSIEDARKLRELDPWLNDSIILGLDAFPMGKIVQGLERDPSTRTQILSEVERFKGSQNNGVSDDGFSARLKTRLLSEKQPAVRRFIGLWCGTSAATLVSEMATRPDEALLIIDGLTQSAQSDVFSDFLEALLRQLPD